MESVTSFSSPHEHCCVGRLWKKWTTTEQQKLMGREQESMQNYGEPWPSSSWFKGSIKGNKTWLYEWADLPCWARQSEHDSCGTGAQRERQAESNGTNTTMSHISGRKMGCWEGNTSKQDYETNPQANEYHWEVYHCKQRWISSLRVKNLSHNQEKQGTKSPYLYFYVGKKMATILSAVFLLKYKLPRFLMK